MRRIIMRWLSCSAAIVAVAIGLSAASEPPTAGSESGSALVTRPTADTQAIVISQKDKVFHPDLLLVKKGDSVLFRNDDPVTHNVFSRTKGSLFNLKMQQPGQEDVVTLQEPGEVTVRCAIHPSMKLTIQVEE
jgi:plastocyanin